MSNSLRLVIGLIATLVGIFLGGTLPIVSYVAASLVWIFLYKKKGLLIGILVSGGAALLNLIITFITNSGSLQNADLITGEIFSVIASCVIGGIIGFMADKFFLKNQSDQQSVTQPLSPWPILLVLTFSFLLSSGAALFLVWQSLKRIGEENVARSFLVVGGVIFLVTQVVGVLMVSKADFGGARYLAQLVGLVFPLWFWRGSYKKWQQNNSIPEKFDWSIVVWTVMGLVLTIIINIVVGSLTN